MTTAVLLYMLQLSAGLSLSLSLSLSLCLSVCLSLYFYYYCPGGSFIRIPAIFSKNFLHLYLKKVKAVNLNSASSCTPKAGSQAGGPAVKPPRMRCQVTNGSRLTTQATAHSLHTQAWAATRPLARQRQSAVGLNLHNPFKYLSIFRSQQLTDRQPMPTSATVRPVQVQLSWWLQWFSVGLVIKRSLVRLPARAPYQVNYVNSAFRPSGVGKSSTSLHGWG